MRLHDLYEAKQNFDPSVGLLNQPGFFALYRLDDDLYQALEEQDWETIEASLLGMMNYKEDIHGDHLVVKSVWARRGWGPLLYEILMTIGGDSGVTPHQQHVSDQAKKVWAYFAGREDIKIVDKVKNPKDFKDYAFVLTQPLSLKAPEARLKNFIKPDPYREKWYALLEVSDLFLSNEMEKMYG